MNEEKLITIYVVTFSGGSARISSAKAVEKEKTYQVDVKTREDYFGWQYVGRVVRKDKNVFTKAKDAAQYASKELAKWIDVRQEELNDARNQIQVLLKMLKAEE